MLHVVLITFSFTFIFIQASIVFHTDKDVVLFRGINTNKWSTTGRMTLNFSVKSCDNVRLALSSNCTGFRPRYVLIIKEKLIYSNRCPRTEKCSRIAENTTNDILDCYNQRKFWISWHNSILSFGKGCVVEQNVQLKVTMVDTFVIDFIGIRSLRTAEWTFEVVLDNIAEIAHFSLFPCLSEAEEDEPTSPMLEVSTSPETQMIISSETPSSMTQNDAEMDKNYNLLECVCPCSAIGNKWIKSVNLTMDELRVYLKDHLIELQNNITVDRKQTTAYKTHKISAKDNRRSSATLGWIAIICICVPIVLAVIADCTRCFR